MHEAVIFITTSDENNCLIVSTCLTFIEYIVYAPLYNVQKLYSVQNKQMFDFIKLVS